MKFFRSFLTIFSFLFFGMGALPLNFIVFPMAKLLLDEKKYVLFSSDLIRKLWGIFIKYLEIIGLIKINIKNKEKIAAIQNKIIVSTHPSFIDILILMSIIPKSTCFVKNSLTKNFVLSNIVNSIFIPNDIDIEALKNETEKYFNLGLNIIIFPMGTRHRKTEHPKIKKGASLIAINSNKNIIPIITNTNEDFLFINQPFYSAGEKTVEFTIEIKDAIEIKNYTDENEITNKRNITKAIETILYS